ncbi:MAG TPA: hypothetical protein VIH90_03845 [Candidatus Saccharimonadales bacterium]
MSIEEPIIQADQALGGEEALIVRESEDNHNWAGSRSGEIVAASYVGLTVSPLNEAIRIGLVGGWALATHNPQEVGLVLFLSTFALEASGGIVTADLLDARGGAFIDKTMDSIKDRFKFIRTVEKRLGRNKRSEDKDLSLGLQAGLAVTAGVPVSMIARYRRSPEKTREQNRLYALVMSLGVSAVLGIEGMIGGESIFHPNLINGLKTGAAFGGAVAGASILKRKLNRSPEGAYDYDNIVKHNTVGPQIEGLSDEEMQEALKDPRTESIMIKEPNGRKVHEVPFIAPIEYAGWLNGKFFNERGYDQSTLYYCLLPQSVLADNRDVVKDKIESILREKGNIQIVVDYPDNSELAVDLPIGELAIDDLITAQQTPAATFHYRAVIEAKGAITEEDQKLDPNVVILSPDMIDANSDRIWDIYSVRFQTLVDDHPIIGALPRDQLLAELKSEDNLVAAYFDAEGVLQGFGNNVSDLGLCPWLNSEYFESQSEGLPIIYQPAIVASQEYALSIGPHIIKTLLSARLAQFNKFMITFECSNASVEYIPKIVSRSILRSNLATISDFTVVRHLYKVANFAQEPQESTS